MKTGITAGWGGASGFVGVQPDLVALAKSIGGGLPLGAFGGKQEYMDEITEGRVVHLGTYNGNPLCMAAASAVLGEICTHDETQATIARNSALIAELDAIIKGAGLPAHTVQFGAKGCVTWSPEPIRNYRDYKATDFDLAFAQWIHGINRGILLPPGLDEQWLISVWTKAITSDDVDPSDAVKVPSMMLNGIAESEADISCSYAACRRNQWPSARTMRRCHPSEGGTG